MQVRLRLQHLAHLNPVLALVALRSRRPHGRPPRGIQQAKLDADGIGYFPHDAAQRIHFPYQVALGDSADCGVGRHLGDQIEVEPKRAVRRPMRAAAMAASQPACPAPTTTMSYCSVNGISSILRSMAAGR